MKPKVKKKEERRRRRAQVWTEAMNVSSRHDGTEMERIGNERRRLFCCLFSSQQKRRFNRKTHSASLSCSAPMYCASSPPPPRLTVCSACYLFSYSSSPFCICPYISRIKRDSIFVLSLMTFPFALSWLKELFLLKHRKRKIPKPFLKRCLNSGSKN